MIKMIKLASLSLVALSALSATASAQTFGFAFSGRGYSAGIAVSSPNYYSSNYGYYGQSAYAAPAYARYTSHEQAHVVYRPVTEARTYYVQRQQAYVARPIVQQVVSQHYVQRSYVENVPVTRTYVENVPVRRTYTQAVPTYSSRVVGYDYQPFYGSSRGYYNY